MMPRGARGFRYLAHNEFGRLTMNAEPVKRGGWPTVQARLSSEWLHMAPAGALSDAEGWLRVATWLEEPSVSEAHCHVDVEGYIPSAISRWVSACDSSGTSRRPCCSATNVNVRCTPSSPTPKPARWLRTNPRLRRRNTRAEPDVPWPSGAQACPGDLGRGRYR